MAIQQSTYDKIELDPPPLCNYDEVYSGVGCVSLYK